VQDEELAGLPNSRRADADARRLGLLREAH
jgi:hypothetical protein